MAVVDLPAATVRTVGDRLDGEAAMDLLEVSLNIAIVAATGPDTDPREVTAEMGPMVVPMEDTPR